MLGKRRFAADLHNAIVYRHISQGKYAVFCIVKYSVDRVLFGSARRARQQAVGKVESRFVVADVFEQGLRRYLVL